jgi:hypothetical protein
MGIGNVNNSSVELQKPDIRLKIVISIGGMICLVILALVFRNVAVFLIAGFGTVAMVGYGTTIWFKFQDGRRLQRQREAETRLIEQKAAQEAIITHRLELAASLHETKTGVFVYGGMDTWTFVPATAGERKEAGLLPATVEMPNLLDEIRTEQCVMFLGPRDSGKTTLALHWLSVRNTQAIVCDVKGFNPWPDNCQVVSGIDDIMRVSQFVLSEMQRRRKKQLVNESSLTLFFDELHYLVSEGIEVLYIAIQIATLGREYNVHAGFTSHADTVKYLKVEGAALLENFTKVRTTKKHICFLDFGEGEFQVIPPGPYNAPVPAQWPDRVDVPMTEAEIIEAAIEAGKSNNEICRDIWGSKNSARIARINTIREGLRVV